MVSLSDVAAGLGLAVVAGVILAGNLVGGGRSSGDALPGGMVVLGVVAALLGGLLIAAIAAHRRSRARSNDSRAG